MARTRTRIAPGIYQDQYGYAIIWPVQGKPKEKRFPLDTPIKVLKDRRARRVELARQQKQLSRGGSLVRDVARFLKLRRGRPSFKSERAHLRAWVQAFPKAHRWAIDRDACAEAVAHWRQAGYSAKTIRHRVRLFKALYAHFDGSHAETPVDDLELPRLPKARPIAVHADVVRGVALELLKHEALGWLRDARTRARFLVLATTGQRPVQVMRAQPLDLDFDRQTWTVRPAKGDAGAVLYLNADMVNAWRLFATAQAWGRYDTRSFARTLRRAGWPAGIRPYTLRHTIGSVLSALDVDLGDIQTHLGHASPTTTRIYVQGHAARARAASQKLQGIFSALPWNPAMDATGADRRTPQNAGLFTTRPSGKKPLPIGKGKKKSA
jgi:integrase